MSSQASGLSEQVRERTCVDVPVVPGLFGWGCNKDDPDVPDTPPETDLHALSATEPPGPSVSSAAFLLIPLAGGLFGVASTLRERRGS